jgi:hypothetical protein
MRGFRGGPRAQYHAALPLAERARNRFRRRHASDVTGIQTVWTQGLRLSSAIANVRSLNTSRKRRRSWKQMNSRRI